mmetsp:Transcript_57091/g.128343  ORF Transcript_57091/g.128343 Transcript_57091/m.128343 type:complete len:205 (+) Transcript_57091:671-1285(+)
MCGCSSFQQPAKDRRGKHVQIWHSEHQLLCSLESLPVLLNHDKVSQPLRAYTKICYCDLSLITTTVACERFLRSQGVTTHPPSFATTFKLRAGTLDLCCLVPVAGVVLLILRKCMGLLLGCHTLQESLLNPVRQRLQRLEPLLARQSSQECLQLVQCAVEPARELLHSCPGLTCAFRSTSANALPFRHFLSQQWMTGDAVWVST